VYRIPGSGNDYDLLSLGADGLEGGEGVDADISAAAGASLMATWFDYTPTTGIDLEVQTIAV
jgi:Type II secretion system (T2SS), protein G